ncbi:MAG TPA: TonB-dependent receptor, partial [Burkholderiaceae bacterium]
APPPSETVIVTGRAGTGVRTKVKASFSVTTISEDALRMQAPTSVTEAMKSVPGFWVEASGGEASGNIRARGIPVDGFGSVTLLEDGIPVQHDPSLGFLNGDQAFRIDETIYRVEVVRGGPSSVFYTNAPAGAINFRSRELEADAQGLIKYTIGDYGLHRADFWYAKPLADGWRAGMGGFYRQDNGIRDPGYKANKGGQIRLKLTKDIDHGRLHFDFKHADDRVMFYLGIPMTTATGDIKAIAGFDGNHGTVAGPETAHLAMKMGDGSLYNYDNTEGTHMKRDQFSVKLEKDLGADWRLTESLRFSKTDTQRNGVFPNTLQSMASFITQSASLLSNVPGATKLGFEYANKPGTAFTGPNGMMIVGGLRGLTLPMEEFISDTRFSRNFKVGSQNHDVTVGYYFNQFDLDFDRFSSSVLLGAVAQAPLLDLVGYDATGKRLGTVTDKGVYQYGYEWENGTGRSTTHALYLSDEWQVNDKLRIDGGIRYETIRTNGVYERPKSVAVGTSFAASRIRMGSGVFDMFTKNFNKTGWTLGANYQLERNSGMFGRWTKAFRLPNLSANITNPTALPIIQTMSLGEVGYKYAGGMFEVYPTMFFSKYDNVAYTNNVFSINNASSTPQTGYASTQTLGLELEGKLSPVKWGDLGFTLTLQNPEYKDLAYTDRINNLPVARNFSGNRLVRVPKVSARIVPAVNLMDNKLRLQAAYEYQGDRWADSANTVRLPSYTVLNLSGRYDISESMQVLFYIDNATNSQGLTEGNPRTGELASLDAGANIFLARPVLGRAIRASIKYEF